jgi:1-acylglycerone phosphate reductase
MLSETLRLELAPLNVRVVTVIAGYVASNLVANAPSPVLLPPTSVYRVIEKQLAKEPKSDDMDTLKFANEVVSAVMSGLSGKVWAGSSAMLAKWIVPIMPWFIYVSGHGYDMGKRTDNPIGSDDDLAGARIR